MKLQMSCQNCRSSKVKFILKGSDYISNDKFDIYQCNHCNILYIDPQPKDLDKYYPKSYRSYIFPINIILEKKYSLFVESINKKFFFKDKNIKKNVLEIGCGKGVMLNEFKKIGWNVAGLERETSIDEKNKLNITNKNPSDFPDQTFDLILMYNSLEHLRNPNNIIKICEAKLKSGGVLLIVVPSYESLQYIFGKDSWLHLDSPRHLFIFSKKTFYYYQSLFSNFKIIEYKTTGIELEFYGWFQTILNKFSLKKNNFHKFLMSLNKSKILLLFGIFQFTILFLPCLFITFISFFFKRTSIVSVAIRKN